MATIRTSVAAAAAALALGATGCATLGSATLFEDEFAEQGVWETASDGDGRLAYEDGRYRIEVAKAEFELHSYRLWEGSPLDGIAFEVDAELDGKDGALSVLCVSSVDEGSERISPNDRYYDFFILPGTGEWGIAATHTKDEPLVAGQDREAIRKDAPNRMRAECESGGEGEPTTLVLHVNDVKVAEHSDAKGFAGFQGVGLAVWSPEGGTAGLFDNAVARER